MKGSTKCLLLPFSQLEISKIVSRKVNKPNVYVQYVKSGNIVFFKVKDIKIIQNVHSN